MSTALQVQQKTDIVSRFSESYGIDQGKLMQVLKATAFKQRGNSEVSNEQMYALMVVSEKYKLNPFVKEIYAFPSQDGGIVPVVGIDGWDSIMNSHPQFDGVEFFYSETLAKSQKPCPEWIEARIYRKDRTRPIIVREYYDECSRNTGPWGSHPKRMLRHKALIQCARIAFGFGGIHDEDEAERIVDAVPPKMAQPTIITDATPTAAVTVSDAVVVETQPSTDATKKRCRPPKSEPVQAEPAKVPEPVQEQAPASQVLDTTGLDDLDFGLDN